MSTCRPEYPTSCTTRGLLILGHRSRRWPACSDTTDAVNQILCDNLHLPARWSSEATRSSSPHAVDPYLAKRLSGGAERRAGLLSDNPTLATLTTKDNKTTLATGVNSGVVQIRAVATGFQGAAPAAFPLRVANPLEIDSMRPSVVRYGEKVTMYGWG